MRLDGQRQYEHQVPARVATEHDGRPGAAPGTDMLMEFGKPHVVLKCRAVGMLFELLPLRFNAAQVAMKRERDLRGRIGTRGLMLACQGRACRHWEIVYLDR